ncbi:MAG: gluconokinase [Pseudomonadota bacterium]
MMLSPRLNVVMGVAGCGKSTTGAALAEHFDGTFLEGDSFHPKSNIEKMSAGTPLTDEDRWPWLDIVAGEMASCEGVVFAGCSALRRAYRDRLIAGAGEAVRFLHLAGDRDLIWERMKARKHHFMKPAMLDSQFATLEALARDECFVEVDIDQSEVTIVREFVAALRE